MGLRCGGRRSTAAARMGLRCGGRPPSPPGHVPLAASGLDYCETWHVLRPPAAWYSYAVAASRALPANALASRRRGAHWLGWHGSTTACRTDPATADPHTEWPPAGHPGWAASRGRAAALPPAPQPRSHAPETLAPRGRHCFAA